MSAESLILEEQLCFALYSTTNAITRAYRPLLRHLDLTYPQYLVMIVLWRERSLSAREISRRLDLPPNAISPVLDRLEAAGLIARTREKHDRRVLAVALTEKGSALESAAQNTQNEIVCRSGLSSEELEHLRNDLVSLRNRIAGEG